MPLFFWPTYTFNPILPFLYTHSHHPRSVYIFIQLSHSHTCSWACESGLYKERSDGNVLCMTVCICEPLTPDVTSAISLTSDLFVGWIFGWIHINRLLDWKILWIKSHGWYQVISACPPPRTPKDMPLSHTTYWEGEVIFLFWGEKKNYLLRGQALRSNGIYVWYWKIYVCADRKNWNALICPRVGCIGAEPHV